MSQENIIDLNRTEYSDITGLEQVDDQTWSRIGYLGWFQDTLMLRGVIGRARTWQEMRDERLEAERSEAETQQLLRKAKWSRLLFKTAEVTTAATLIAGTVVWFKAIWHDNKPLDPIQSLPESCKISEYIGKKRVLQTTVPPYRGFHEVEEAIKAQDSTGYLRSLTRRDQDLAPDQVYRPIMDQSVEQAINHYSDTGDLKLVLHYLSRSPELTDYQKAHILAQTFRSQTQPKSYRTNPDPKSREARYTVMANGCAESLAYNLEKSVE